MEKREENYVFQANLGYDAENVLVGKEIGMR